MKTCCELWLSSGELQVLISIITAISLVWSCLTECSPVILLVMFPSPLTSHILFCSPELVHSWENGHCSVPYIPRMVDLSMPKVLKLESIYFRSFSHEVTKFKNVKPKSHICWYLHRAQGDLTCNFYLLTIFHLNSMLGFTLDTSAVWSTESD